MTSITPDTRPSLRQWNTAAGDAPSFATFAVSAVPLEANPLARPVNVLPVAGKATERRGISRLRIRIDPNRRDEIGFLLSFAVTFILLGVFAYEYALWVIGP